MHIQQPSRRRRRTILQYMLGDADSPTPAACLIYDQPSRRAVTKVLE
jgi:hypothetical protein